MKNNRIIEAGHYYKSKGATQMSIIGWDILKKIKQPNDKTSLLIDDVHALADLHHNERNLSVTKNFNHDADYILMESEMKTTALDILEILKNLPKRKKATLNNGKWFCSGFPITDNQGNPLCVLLDTGLTLTKKRMGFNKGVNILPFYYEEEQRRLLRLIKKTIPDFKLSIILFNDKGEYWEMY